MAGNNLENYGVAVAELLAESRSIQNIKILEENHIIPYDYNAVMQVISEHNRLVQERHAISEVLEGVVSRAGAEYGSLADVMQLIGHTTGDDFDNIIMVN